MLCNRENPEVQLRGKAIGIEKSPRERDVDIIASQYIQRHFRFIIAFADIHLFPLRHNFNELSF